MNFKASLALTLCGISSTALSQALPQSAPSSDWASFSTADAGTAQPPTATPPPADANAPTPPPPAATQPATQPPAQPTGTPPANDSSMVPAPPTPPPGATTEVAGSSTTKTIPTPLATPGSADASIGDAAATRLTSSVEGPVGLYKVLSAEPGTPGVLRFGLTGQVFTYNNFPVVGANDTREVGTLTLAFTPLKFLDVYVGTEVQSNDSTPSTAADTVHATNPNFISELGDFWGGVKVGGFITTGIGLALDVRGEAYSGIGTNSLAAGAFIPTAIFTADLAQIARVPVRLHLNVGGRFGDITDLSVPNGNGSTISLRAPEQFALGASAYNAQINAAVGVEVPLPYVTPFVEYNVNAPVGGNTNLLGPDQLPVSYGNALPNDLDVGLRVTAIRDVSLLVGADFSFQQNVALGVPILPPWEVFFGLAYNVDLFAKNQITVVEHSVQTAAAAPAAAPTGIVNGTVEEQDTKAPIVGAVVQASGSPGLVASDSTGHFQTYPLPAGPIDLIVTKDGYKGATAKALVVAGQPATAEVFLEREAKPASLHISAHSQNKPISAQVTVTGPNGFSQDQKLGDDGQGQIAVPNAGNYTLKFLADGFLGTLRKIDVGAGAAVPVDVELAPVPKRSVLVITDKKITLKKQIHFQTGEASILPDSTPILEELLSAILSKGIDKLRVEGHTDNVGGKAKNQKLSQDRADAVLQWLVEHGVAPERLEAVGYGDSKPVAPNLTSRGRALNRRVEFDIL